MFNNKISLFIDFKLKSVLLKKKQILVMKKMRKQKRKKKVTGVIVAVIPFGYLFLWIKNSE